MKNIFLGLSLMLALPMAASAYSYDNSVSATLRRVEVDRNAKCEYTRSSRFGLGFGDYQWSKAYYYCAGNEGSFRLTLKVRKELDYEATYSGPYIDPARRVYKNPIVTEIIYN